MAAAIAPETPEVMRPRPLLEHGCGPLTLDDWYALPETPDRYELLHGMLIMVPPPGGAHQSAVAVVASSLLGASGNGFAWTRIGVGLSASLGFEPDVSHVAATHMDRYTTRGIEGPPDIVVEVLSPSTREYDRTTKLPIYLAFGVREVWLVDPLAETLEVHAPGREVRRVKFGEHIPSDVVDVGSAGLEFLPQPSS